MEPRPHERGKSGIFARSNGIKRGLQWSHVLTNVESSRPRSPKQHERTLQWSHVLTNVERRLLLLPWLWLRRFNGATSSRTWKAVCTVRSNTDEKLQWSHVLTNVERFDHLKRPRRDDCFNGATSSRTWKAARIEQPAQPKRASMEPRPHERGKNSGAILNSSSSTLQWSHVLTNVESHFPANRFDHRGAGFNGATSSRTWKAETSRSVFVCEGELQWSHVLTNVERPFPSRISAPHSEASMEPRPHERGKVQK